MSSRHWQLRSTPWAFLGRFRSHPGWFFCGNWRVFGLKSIKFLHMLSFKNASFWWHLKGWDPFKECPKNSEAWRVSAHTPYDVRKHLYTVSDMESKVRKLRSMRHFAESSVCYPLAQQVEYLSKSLGNFCFWYEVFGTKSFLHSKLHILQKLRKFLFLLWGGWDHVGN